MYLMEITITARVRGPFCNEKMLEYTQYSDVEFIQ
jgi:hypothetical protein